MAEALKVLPQSQHPDLLVGFNKADDAGVFRIREDLALVQTLDFFPPIVDDPYQFGQIAAANALSDIYAMGGKPITALSIVGFPMNLPAEVLTEMLRGGSDKIEEAGAVVIGGHSIKDKELKYGVSVTGLIHPDKVLTNDKCQPGDNLYLTKPLGTGIITTGIKNQAVSKDLENAVIEQMAQLNNQPVEIMLKHQATAVTDITGFGLLGHTFEMADASGVSIRIYSADLPIIQQALELAEQGMLTGGANANREYLNDKIQFVNKIESNLGHLLFDPQTSGGLLIAIPSNNAPAFEQEMNSKGVFFKKIGESIRRDNFAILIE